MKTSKANVDEDDRREKDGNGKGNPDEGDPKEGGNKNDGGKAIDEGGPKDGVNGDDGGKSDDESGPKEKGNGDEDEGKGNEGHEKEGNENDWESEGYEEAETTEDEDPLTADNTPEKVMDDLADMVFEAQHGNNVPEPVRIEEVDTSPRGSNTQAMSILTMGLGSGPKNRSSPLKRSSGKLIF
jgi:hypothetical protein